ncbi:MAG: TetR/AcrR family transcriptional regulator [Phreatobacter sp.]
MASTVRDRMIDGALALLAERGLQATSFSELLSATGVPRGSLYHHFPGGKDQLIAEAVDRAGAVLRDALAPVAGAKATDVVERLLAIWRVVVTRSDCRSGCAVVAVTIATDSAELSATAAAVFRDWRVLLAGLLQQGGLRAPQADQFAVLLIASIEGAVVLSRAERSLEPFELVAGQLMEQVRSFAAMPAKG